MPDDLVIATTEVGLPAALNPGKVIVDKAGLNETTIARNGFSADWLLERYAPDLIYLPHPHYRGMARALVGNPAFVAGYQIYSSQELGGVLMGVAVRRDGPYANRLRAIMDQALVQP